MAFSQFPPAATGGAGDTAFAAEIAVMATTYEHDNDFAVGIYDITIVPSSTNAQVIFLDATSVITTTNTTTGAVSIQLNSPATKVFITGQVGGTAGAIIKIAKTAAILTPDDIGNGTLDTINSTGTYNQTGLLSVLLFGGGGAGSAGGIGYGSGGAGGAAGSVALGVVYNNGATTVTVGAKGTAAVSNNTNITAPNDSSFGNLLTSANSGFFYVATAGGGGSGNSGGNSGTATRSFASFNSNSTTGGGGGGGKVNYGGSFVGGGSPGAGSGIGTGGTSATTTGVGNGTNSNPSVKGAAGTGKASGGGGGNSTGNNHPSAAGRFGGDGTDGVVYILRGF